LSAVGDAATTRPTGSVSDQTSAFGADEAVRSTSTRAPGGTSIV
jgi:hypothetical protein